MMTFPNPTRSLDMEYYQIFQQEDLIDPAVKGTLNVIASCAKFPTVKRLILTSSTSAVMYTGRPLTEDTVLDETWFSSPEACKGFSGDSYALSKTLAEEAAWSSAKEKGIDMVSICPALVIGPMLQPVFNWSSDRLFSLVDGRSETYPNAAFGWVHVKDVAEAHIRALEIPSASGRYIVSETVAHFGEAVNMLRQLYPNLNFPDKCEDDQPLLPTFKISKDKVDTLGIQFISLEETLKETVEWLKEKKLISA